MNDNRDVDKRYTRSASDLLIRTLATTAVWSVAMVVSARLRHPMIGLAMMGMAVALTLLIWTYRSKN